ncbi:PREDICTED: EF-hand calcium-binding domain-containing protein 1-like [Atta colombica]|uniref:EF-hand calcium-binding domain-containing protein 1-like n=1 Tax=Atta colombica TaxID=520822 RepID=UPI00084CE55F|nr:PREDICTED: EF-hand calcium-binding domain-containing protein 1-like [Atta colombica]
MPIELPVDMLNKPLSEIVFRRKNNVLFKKLAQKTHFNVREIEALAVIHRKITQTLGPMTRMVFRDVLHSGLDFTENIRHLYIDRIFSAFDKKNVLQIYDFMHTNKIKKEQVFPSMRGCLIKLETDEDPDDAVKDLLDLLLKKLDVNRDGVISEEEFCRAVKERNLLLLECMGPVFPSRVARRTFLSTFTDRLGRF